MKDLHSISSKFKMPLGSIKSAYLTAMFVSGSFCSFSKEFVCNSNPVKIDIVSQPPRPLAYQLLSLKAEFRANSTVILNWSTESEKNTSHYIMQRSIDGHVFNDAALVFTKEGETNKKIEYSYTDDINELKTKLVYYRLKIVGAFGKETYSEAVVIRKTIQVLITIANTFNNDVACK